MSNNFNCNQCDSSFGLKSNLTKHVKKYHSDSDVVCSEIKTVNNVNKLNKENKVKIAKEADNRVIDLLNEIERLKSENIQNLEIQKLRLENQHLKQVNSLISSHNEELKNIINLTMSQKHITPIVVEAPVAKKQNIEVEIIEDIESEVEQDKIEDIENDEEFEDEGDVQYEKEVQDEPVIEVKPVKKDKKPASSNADKIQNILNEKFHYAENIDDFINHLNEVSIISAVDSNDQTKGNIFNTMIPRGLISNEKDAITYLKDKMKRVLANGRTPLAVYNKKLYVKVTGEWILHTKEISRITTKLLLLMNDAVSNLDVKVTANIKNKYEMYRKYNLNEIQSVITDAIMLFTCVIFDDDILKRIEKCLIKDLM